MIAIPSLEPIHYYDEQILKSERVDVFEKNWIFAGFKSQLANHNDFITLKVGNTPIVVQNFKGQFSALLNICSHRRATLQTASCGNRPLVCPYHCWSYKSDGALAGVPQNNSDFGLDAADKTNLSLKRFCLEMCGDFMFVRVSSHGSSLETFLGPYYLILQQLSVDFSDPVEQGEYVWNTNWKLACETVLEVYHVAGVHPETFAKFAKAECEIEFFNGHSTGHTPLLAAPKKWWEGARKLLKIEQNQTYTEYNHFFIYPNLAIGITSGSLLSLQTYEPINEIQSRLTFNLRMIKGIEGQFVSGAVKTAIKQNSTEFNHTILEEDRKVAETCQQNMPCIDSPGLLGKSEERIMHFHNALKHDLKQIMIRR